MKQLLKSLYLKNYKFRSPRVLGRVACLGDELVTRLDLKRGLVNHQKTRIDYLLSTQDNSSLHCKPEQVIPYLDRKYIKGCIIQQAYHFFDYPSPDLIIMDSYSELTDQLFEHRQNKWCFLANYSDMNHSNLFERTFLCKGLLPIENFEMQYNIFFNKLVSVYPNTPIIFFHYPTFKEKRIKFVERAQKIQTIIKDLSKKFPLQSICLNESDVTTMKEYETDQFPYHYSNEIYRRLMEGYAFPYLFRQNKVPDSLEYGHNVESVSL